MTTLDELRRANLQEQRKSAQSEPPTSTPAAIAQPTVLDLVEAMPSVPAAPSTEPAKPVPAAVAEQPPLRGHENGHAKAKPAADLAPAEPTDDLDPYTRKSRAVMDRFYRGLARKVIHPTGVKATVDMPPELFWRVKRYCHDHNNVTVRQLFLDLVTALLDEEGY